MKNLNTSTHTFNSVYFLAHLVFSLFFILPSSILYAQDNTIPVSGPGYTINVPSGYKVDKNVSPSNIIVLSPENSDYPNFNIVVNLKRGTHLDRISESAWPKVVKEDYRLVGISRILVSGTKTIFLEDGSKVVIAEIEYDLNSTNIKSIVGLTQDKDYNFIITYKDLATEFEKRSSEFDRIISGLKISNPLLLPSTKSESNINFYYIAGACLFLILFLASRTFKKKKGQ